MRYGLSNSTSIFQVFMNEMFREFIHRFVIFYINEILIYSQNLAEHCQHVTQVLQRLREQHLYRKLEKLVSSTTIPSLSFPITKHGVQMDQRKVDAIRKWPQPTAIKDLQCFQGFGNFYRRFISNFSLISTPLTTLLRNRPKSLS